MINSSSINWY